MHQGAILDTAKIHRGAILDKARMHRGAIFAVLGSLSRGAILGLDGQYWLVRCYVHFVHLPLSMLISNFLEVPISYTSSLIHV